MERGYRGAAHPRSEVRELPPARARHPRRQGADRRTGPDNGRQGRQPLARREQPAGAVAHLAARRLPGRQAAMAHRHRRRRARQAGGQVLGLARRRLPGARTSPLPRLPEPRRDRRRRRSGVRSRHRPLRRGRLHPSRSQDFRRLGRCRHPAGRHRLRQGLAHDFRLRANPEAVEAGDSARFGAHFVRGRNRRRRHQPAGDPELDPALGVRRPRQDILDQRAPSADPGRPAGWCRCLCPPTRNWKT